MFVFVFVFVFQSGRQVPSGPCGADTVCVCVCVCVSVRPVNTVWAVWS